ncbi:hypothetical protein NLI96_g7568 [Meripilus lineatus]|uniref:FAD dependent oxidoreductase domain-containing protein n=1 Tax=Meripilus lineatus TaxID=2056292 RepID=A0AAD5YET0_9APHY|nr:hypothetical protein NLI96_g7568 [Physisporinus lineatus]
MIRQDKRHVVILGAGVIGLTIAHVITTRHPSSFRVTIVARDLPEDISQAFASPWAGANWAPRGPYDPRIYKMEYTTFNKFWNMGALGLTCNVPSRIYFTKEVDVKTIWYKNLVRNFRVLSPEEVPCPFKGGISYSTITVNPQKYLPWLKADLTSRGVLFVRQQIHNIDDAAELAGPNGIVFNATGLGARSLIGVEDPKVYPVRGQTITVLAPDVKQCVAWPVLESPAPNGDTAYMIPRPAPHGHVLLGGTYQEDNWDTSIDFNIARRIWKRATELVPALNTEKTKIISHNVGLRPARKGGPRIELEWLKLPVVKQSLEDIRLKTSTYSGSGYQCSWGAAEEAVELLSEL